MDKKKEVKYPNLVSEMARNGETQKTIGEILGLTSASVSRKLSGQVAWSIEEVDKICEYFGKDYYQLFK